VNGKDWVELDQWVKFNASPLSASAENELCEIVERIVATAYEESAALADRMAEDLEEGRRELLSAREIAEAIRKLGKEKTT